MTEKNTRGRASKVDLLPPNIKTQLAMMLRDKQYKTARHNRNYKSEIISYSRFFI